MQLDPVHDVQRAYRKLVEATSFPGRIVDVSTEAARIDLDTDVPKPLLLLSVMLLDAEVCFHLSSQRAESHVRLVSQLTYSRVAPPEEAGFLFVCRQAWYEAVAVISQARIGTLTDPHHGATVVLEVDSLEHGAHEESAAEMGTGRSMGSPASDGLAARPRGTGVATASSTVLSGPGIDNRTRLVVRGPDGWESARAERNGEYPLGVDFILVTARGRLVSLPRTTQLEVSRWGT